MKKRCGWHGEDTLYVDYHDTEWGLPVHDDRTLFEMIVLDGAQAGLSWITILKRRDSYREAFDNFDARKVAAYDERKIAALLENPGIIRNRLKVNSAVQNARAFLEVSEEFGTFDKYIWQFVGQKPLQSSRKSLSDIPPR